MWRECASGHEATGYSSHLDRVTVETADDTKFRGDIWPKHAGGTGLTTQYGFT